MAPYVALGRQEINGGEQVQDAVERGRRRARRLRQVLTAVRTVFQEIRDPEFGCDVETLGHHEALDEMFQDKRRRGIVGGRIILGPHIQKLVREVRIILKKFGAC
jgi:hypothetical protein